MKERKSLLIDAQTNTYRDSRLRSFITRAEAIDKETSDSAIIKLIEQIYKDYYKKKEKIRDDLLVVAYKLIVICSARLSHISNLPLAKELLRIYFTSMHQLLHVSKSEEFKNRIMSFLDNMLIQQDFIYIINSFYELLCKEKELEYFFSGQCHCDESVSVDTPIGDLFIGTNLMPNTYYEEVIKQIPSLATSYCHILRELFEHMPVNERFVILAGIGVNNTKRKQISTPLILELLNTAMDEFLEQYGAEVSYSLQKLIQIKIEEASNYKSVCAKFISVLISCDSDVVPGYDIKMKKIFHHIARRVSPVHVFKLIDNLLALDQSNIPNKNKKFMIEYMLECLPYYFKNWNENCELFDSALKNMPNYCDTESYVKTYIKLSLTGHKDALQLAAIMMSHLMRVRTSDEIDVHYRERICCMIMLNERSAIREDNWAYYLILMGIQKGSPDIFNDHISKDPYSYTLALLDVYAQRAKYSELGEGWKGLEYFKKHMLDILEYYIKARKMNKEFSLDVKEKLKLFIADLLPRHRNMLFYEMGDELQLFKDLHSAFASARGIPADMLIEMRDVLIKSESPSALVDFLIAAYKVTMDVKTLDNLLEFAHPMQNVWDNIFEKLDTLDSEEFYCAIVLLGRIKQKYPAIELTAAENNKNLDDLLWRSINVLTLIQKNQCRMFGSKKTKTLHRTSYKEWLNILLSLKADPCHIKDNQCALIQSVIHKKSLGYKNAFFLHRCLLGVQKGEIRLDFQKIYQCHEDPISLVIEHNEHNLIIKLMLKVGFDITRYKLPRERLPDPLTYRILFEHAQAALRDRSQVKLISSPRFNFQNGVREQNATEKDSLLIRNT